MKNAICQCADSGPLESLIEMLSSVGYHCYVPSRELKEQLKALGCDNVSDIDHLVRNEGYETPKVVTGEGEYPIPEAYPADMLSCDLYVDIKGHRNGPKVWKKYPRLEKRTLWYRINGGKAEHVVNERGDMGNEANPPCPVLTPNQWYSHETLLDSSNEFSDALSTQKLIRLRERSYACWPPFVRFGEYAYPRPHVPHRDYDRMVLREKYTAPICLVHNFQGWGYGPLLAVAKEFGTRIHGVRSPDGLLQHREVKIQLSQCLAYLHLKSSDAPGYALYEALASACPVVCSRRLIWKNRMEGLLIPGETCYVFDRPTHDPISQEEVAECRKEIGAALRALSSSQENIRVGENGRKRLQELMWSKDRPEDVASLKDFFARNFGI